MNFIIIYQNFFIQNKNTLKYIKLTQKNKKTENPLTESFIIQRTFIFGSKI